MYPAHRSAFRSRDWLLHRPLSKSRGNNPVSDEIPFKIADLTVDEAYAHRFLEKVRDVHHFKTSKWKDVKITICI